MVNQHADCIFCKIINRQIPTPLVYEDDLIVAFDDIDPKAPCHKLIIPRQHIATLNDVSMAEQNLLGHMLKTSSHLAKQFNIAAGGYRTVMNCNADAGQTVFHIHLHLLGGRHLAWPPG